MSIRENLASHVPTYEKNNTLYNEIFKTAAIELEQANVVVEKNNDELFFDTATQALEIYERELGIEKNTLSNSQRRDQIVANFLKNFEQTTDSTLRAVASIYTDGHVEVFKGTVDGVYEIMFKDGTIPYDNDAFQRLIYKIMPAHLAWVIGGRSQSKSYTSSTIRSGATLTIYPKGEN